jgi:hypothetical protein
MHSNQERLPPGYCQYVERLDEKKVAEIQKLAILAHTRDHGFERVEVKVKTLARQSAVPYETSGYLANRLMRDVLESYIDKLQDTTEMPTSNFYETVQRMALERVYALKAEGADLTKFELYKGVFVNLQYIVDWVENSTMTPVEAGEALLNLTSYHTAVKGRLLHEANLFTINLEREVGIRLDKHEANVRAIREDLGAAGEVLSSGGSNRARAWAVATKDGQIIDFLSGEEPSNNQLHDIKFSITKNPAPPGVVPTMRDGEGDRYAVNLEPYRAYPDGAKALIKAFKEVFGDRVTIVGIKGMDLL